MEGSSTSPEIVFFDLGTTVPNRTGQRFWVLEFGAIVVCPKKLVELESYSTLIRPKDLSVVALRSSRSDGITRDAVANAPEFEQVAAKIYSILNGRIWAGHNIQRFDCVRIKEAFAKICRPAPMPMASLATYFGLGQQKHRSLDDVRMNLEVLKYCATVLFLESSLPSKLNGSTWQSPSMIITTSRSNYTGKLTCREDCSRKSPPTPIGYQRTVVPYTRGSLGKMTEIVKNLLCKAQGSRPLNNLLKHSHSLLLKH
ncbi:Exonuclease [Corchorus capsularis]|uniref:Exonuclease n=1 Tax=Corchorus capsularis TaxID=210143 RepID=A0A1R3GD65_COCAP|nr:Exonuclease [Corchorus capsularis]